MHGCYPYGRGGMHRMFMGRHFGGRGSGRFAGGFRDSRGSGGGELRAGRKLSSADLQLLILALLAEKPSHGYELIKALEERSSGFYSPSPGMVYPALTYLEELGYARVEAEGTRKLYRITDEGSGHLEKNRSVADSLLQQLEAVGRKMERVRRVFSGEEESLEEDGGPTNHRRGFPEMWLVYRELKLALLQATRGGPEEHMRIAEILRRALAEIHGKSASGENDKK